MNKGIMCFYIAYLEDRNKLWNYTALEKLDEANKILAEYQINKGEHFYNKYNKLAGG